MGEYELCCERCGRDIEEWEACAPRNDYGGADYCPACCAELEELHGVDDEMNS